MPFLAFLFCAIFVKFALGFYYKKIGQQTKSISLRAVGQEALGDAINAKAQALTDAAMKMGQQIYEKEQAAAASPGAGAAAADGAEDVVDAEFSEVDENNKG